MGVQESIMRAAIAPMVPADKRGSAYGIFNAAYGVCWFLSSALMGALYDTSITALIGFSYNHATGLDAVSDVGEDIQGSLLSSNWPF